jgi:hypothetical protein
MTLLWVEGFESYGTVNSAISPSNIFDQKYVSAFDDRLDISVGPGATSGNCIRLDSSSTFFITPVLTTSRTLICGFAFKLRDVDSGITLCDFRASDNDGWVSGWQMLNFRINTVNGANQISFYRATAINDTSNGVDIQPDTWYYFEAKVYCDETNGTWVVKIDGNEVMNGTGDTQLMAAHNYHSRIMWSMIASGDLLYIDDVYICDTEGSKNNDFLGTCNVVTIRPDGDVISDWQPDTGGTLYTQIDEMIQDSSYISNATSGNQATFTFNSMASVSGAIAGVMLNTDCILSGNLTKHPFTLTQNGSGGSIGDASGVVPSVNLITTTEIFEEDADGNVWTETTVNDARFGVEISS